MRSWIYIHQTITSKQKPKPDQYNDVFVKRNNLVWPKDTDTDLDFLSQVAKHLFSFRSVYLCVCILTRGIWLQEEQRYDPNPNTDPSIAFTGSWISTLAGMFSRECPEVTISSSSSSHWNQLSLSINLDQALKHKFAVMGHMEAIQLSVLWTDKGMRI